MRWLESQRAVLDAPAYADYFLQWPNGTLYTEPETTRPHGGFSAQGFWDFRNASAAAYYVSSVLETTAGDAVDGTFADDVTGVPAEHPNIVPALKLTEREVATLQYVTQETNAALIAAAVKAGKYVWQAFGNSDGAAPGPTTTTCTTWMRSHCTAAQQSVPLLMQFDASSAAQSIAAFLVIRPPNGYIGFGWYSNDDNWDPIFLMQPGIPLGLCAEGPTGVFARNWTGGTAALDCNTWNASLPFPALPRLPGP